MTIKKTPEYFRKEVLAISEDIITISDYINARTRLNVSCKEGHTWSINPSQLLTIGTGKNCNICSHCFIENDVIIGNNVTIKSGVQLWDGLRIGNNVFIGPNVTFTNDKYPISGNRDYERLTTIVEDNASIGANSTILPGVTIGQGAVIGAGSVVTKSVEPFTKVFGNPAEKAFYEH